MLGNNGVSILFQLNESQFSFIANIDLVIAGCIAVFIVCFWIYRWVIKPRQVKLSLTKVQLKIGGVVSTYEIERNYENIEIAHKIFIELITRKAAIEIDEDYDSIIEVYDSWYELFKVTREEIKNISGQSLISDTSSSKLIELATDVLNKGLRPHLTMYQADFRKWYDEKLNQSQGKSPQEIQKEYTKWPELLSSIKSLNGELLTYSKQLKLIVQGE